MGIKLSNKYGFNPSVEKCAICGESIRVVCFGALYKDENGKAAEAPHEVCMGNICDSCKRVISEGGIFFIEVRDGERGNNPYRTGRVIAVKEEAIKSIFKGYGKVNYVERSIWEKVFPNMEK